MDNVSLTAKPGRETGLLGPNHADKATTARAMVGLTASASGTATIDGGGVGTIPRDAGWLTLPGPG